MVKYIFLGSPYNSSWINITSKLYETKIAEPVIFVGHDRHYKESIKIFGNNVIEDFKIRHRPYEIYNIDYNGIYSNFFESENYIRAKDICLKMMDRLDTYGVFNRLDREAYFHQLCILYLKKIELSKPELLISAESPHDHCRYVIYEIARFLKLPCFKFNNWTIAPLLIFQNLETNKPLKNSSNIDFKEYYMLIKTMIKDYIISVEDTDYEIDYMKDQRKNKGNAKIFKKKTSTNYFKDFKHNVGMFIKQKYNPINPYRLNLFTRTYIINKRKNNLLRKSKNFEDTFDNQENYVYYPLHFEPERTTNPDAGDYHDQFKVLSIIRDIIPKDFKIYVKEHPSQIYYSEKGSRGRSPLFYQLIKNIKSLKIINSDYNSQSLIKNSKCVFTLTGTVALESAILKKPCVTFGSTTWYSGCPNTITYSKSFDFNQISRMEIKSSKKVYDYLIHLMKEYSIPGIMNYSQLKYFKKFDDKEFKGLQEKLLFDFFKNFFSNQIYTR